MGIGENIKAIRESKNISLIQFSAMTGIDAESCEKIEAGSRALNASEIQSICMALGVSFETLVAQRSDPEPEMQPSVLMPVDELQKLLGKM